MNKLIRFYLILTIFLTSCDKLDKTSYQQTDNDNIACTSTRVLTTASDPYKLDVMQSALDLIAETTPAINEIILSPTDYYVRFLPADTLQMEILQTLGIELFPYPLDSMETPADDIEEEPENFNPETDDEPFISTWTYAVVPYNFTFPEGIQHETLYPVFIQKPTSLASEQQLSTEVYNQVLSVALTQTGNISSARTASNEWQPSATISYLHQKGETDNQDIYRPLPGVKVRVRQYTNISFKHTNNMGETGAICTARGPVTYDIAWQCCCCNIHKVNTLEMYTTTLATSWEGPLDYRFDSGQGLALAGIYRALRAYFHENHLLTTGLAKPARMNVAFINQYHAEKTGTYDFTRRNPIFIWGLTNDNRTYRDAQSTMQTAFHELGHASHFALDGTDIIWSAKRHRESWANGIEYAYMKSLYPDYVGQPNSDSDNYTRVVECLMLQGVPLSQIQKAIHASKWWDGWQDNMKNHCDLPDAIVDMIFNHPNDVCFDLKDMLTLAPDKLTKYYKDQLICFNKISDASAFTISNWEIAEGQGEIIYSDVQRGAFLFEGSGNKTVSAEFTLFDGLKTTVTKTVHISPTSIINVPEQAFTYTDIHCSITDDDYIDAMQISAEWESSPRETLQKKNSLNPVLKYGNYGEKTITANIHYNSPVAVTIPYTRTINVKPLPVNEHFRITTPPPYTLNTPYTLKYQIDGQKVTVDHVNYIHRSFCIWLSDPWSFDPSSNLLTIEFLSNIGIDYVIEIFYHINGSSETLLSEVTVSNFE